jgi:hypothetical protein
MPAKKTDTKQAKPAKQDVKKGADKPAKDGKKESK